VSGSWFGVVLDSYLEVGSCAVGSSCSLDCYCVAVEEDTGDECCPEVIGQGRGQNLAAGNPTCAACEAEDERLQLTMMSNWFVELSGDS